MSIKLLMRTNLWKISKSNALFLLKYMNMYVILARLNEQHKTKRKRKKVNNCCHENYSFPEETPPC